MHKKKRITLDSNLNEIRLGSNITCSEQIATEIHVVPRYSLHQRLRQTLLVPFGKDSGDEVVTD